MDLISGISVSSLGHCHPAVVEAVQKQAAQFMHLMVYGEYVYRPQVQLAQKLCSLLPSSLDSVYLVNSGAEATEGAIKLARRVTGRPYILSFRNSYHGSTTGALSLLGDEYWRQAYRPLMPGNKLLRYNEIEDLALIDQDTAAVFFEPVQAESGVRVPDKAYVEALRARCSEQGALLVFDEIQTAFGRTGKLFAMDHYDVVPDVLLLAKGLGGGMPIGAFISSKERMQTLSHDPVLGHITTFGGNPVCCAAALATVETISSGTLVSEAEGKGKRFEEKLNRGFFKSLNRIGLMMALDLGSFEQNKKVIDACIADGLITDWFLFAPYCLRIAPPLIISEEEIDQACEILNRNLEKAG